MFAEFCVCGCNRPPPSATVCVRAVRLSTMTSASGVLQKVSQVDSCRRSYIGVSKRGVCLSDLCLRSYFGVCRGCLGERSASPHLYWCLLTRCLCE